jgi:hypothetical protein
LDNAAESVTLSASAEVSFTGEVVKAELDMRGAVDIAAERKWLAKDLAAAEKNLATAEATLRNPAFIANAPDDRRQDPSSPAGRSHHHRAHHWQARGAARLEQEPVLDQFGDLRVYLAGARPGGAEAHDERGGLRSPDRYVLWPDAAAGRPLVLQARAATSDQVAHGERQR